MKPHYTAKELAGLPGMPGTDRAIRDLADRENWPSQKRPGRGGGREYAVTALPPETQQYLAGQHLDTLASDLPVPRQKASVPAPITAVIPELTALTRHQVAVMDARVWFMRLIEKRAKGQSVKRCQHEIASNVADGKQPYAQMAAAANDRKGTSRALAPRTLMRWWAAWGASGKKAEALAPSGADAKRVSREAVLIAWVKDHKPGQRSLLPAEIPAWLPWFLDAYRRPQKPAKTDALRDMRREMPSSIAMPSYDQVDRICEKIPQVYLHKGRMTGAEYKSILGFNRRDFSEMDPFTVGQIDGHSFKAYVAHPTTGAHFHPEVCGIICMTTKILAGWSAGLAESSRTVGDAYRHACTINEQKPWGGVFASIEADLGAGNKARVNSDELTGLFARIGTQLLYPEVAGNPQGHGGIERSNQSIWIRAAKELPTYTGKDMDRSARKRIYTRLERDLKAVENEGKLGVAEKTSKLLYSWNDFLAALEQWAIEYNNTPHSALPKITDETTGRRRHMTPFEALADRIAKGWQPVQVDKDILPHLFMPHERITVRRCEFNLHGNRYHSYELHQHHDQQMIAAYDVHNAESVHVLDMDERLICVAKWNGNKLAGRPVSEVEQYTMQRSQRQKKLLTRKLDLREAETREAVVIQHSEALQAKRLVAEADVIEEAVTTEPVRNNVIRLPVPEGFKVPEDRRERWAVWNQLHERVVAMEELTDAEMQFYASFRNSPTWKSFALLQQVMQ